MAHLAPDLTAFLSAWLPPAPARVLDVGCGGGASTDHLCEIGFDVLGIDPEPPGGDRFLATRLEDFATGSPFDAAVAIRSLHHVEDLDRGVARLHAALPRGGRLVIFEFAIENVDAAALRWQIEAGIEPPLRGELPGVTSLRGVRDALAKCFRELRFEPAPYLAREAGRDDLHGQELAAIKHGELRPAGARLALERI